MNSVAASPTASPTRAEVAFPWRDVAVFTWTAWIVSSVVVALIWIVPTFVPNDAEWSFGTRIGLALMLSVISTGILAGVFWATSPVAWLLGKALRRVRSVAVHVLAFALFGVVPCVLLFAIDAVAFDSHTFGSLQDGGTGWPLYLLGFVVTAAVARLVTFRWIRRREAKAARVAAHEWGSA